MTRVSSHKKKTLCENFAFSRNFHISFTQEKCENLASICLAKKYETFAKKSCKNFAKKIVQKIREKKYCENFVKKWKSCKKQKFREKYRIFKNNYKILAKINQKRLNVENTRLIFKKRFICDPN